MKKGILIVFVCCAVLLGTGCGAITQKNITDQGSNIPASSAGPKEQPDVSKDPGYKNVTIEIDGNAVTLVDGLSEIAVAPGSSTKIITKFFGNEAFGDLNEDGKEDVAFLITQDGGGSGTFFYIVAALGSETGYQGTNAIFLGDRIAPQSTHMENGQIVVNFAERKPEDPFTTPPSLDVSKRVRLVDGKLVEDLE